jgi:hypothetical protein
MPIIPHIAYEKKEKLTFNMIFKSIHLLIMDITTSEYLFTLDFFEDTNIFSEIFTKSLSFIESTVKQYLTNSFDLIGILIMIRLTKQLQNIMKTRKIDSLDKYFENVFILLWPRYKYLFDLNVISISETKAEDIISSESINYNITKRYSEFISVIHILNKEDDFKDNIQNNLITLYKKFKSLFDDICSKKKTNIEKIIFLLNSYDIILNNFHKYEITCYENKEFNNLFDSLTNDFIEEELSLYFNDLITFIKKVEPNISKDYSYEVNKSKVNVTELEKYAKDFEKGWKASLKNINSDIIKSFQNFKTGNVILRKVLTQLLLYYSRFDAIIYLIYQNPPFRSNLVSHQSILYEMKNYSKDFDN